MKTQMPVLRGPWLFTLVFALLAPLSAAFGQSTSFTYQGQLRDGGTNANGSYSMVFKLKDSMTGGSQVGSTVTFGSQFVTNGQFNVLLDFGDVFDGSSRWLEMTVDGNLMSPRMQIESTPYALYATKAGAVQNPSFVGTTGNTALELYVNNSRALRLEPNSNSPNLTGGYSLNVISNGFFGSVIAGGGGGNSPDDGQPSHNIIGANFAFIGGGARNLVTGEGGVVGGGFVNVASAGNAVVGGGDSNTASGNHAFVGAGSANVASGISAVVAGGSDNQAMTDGSFIGGGQGNSVNTGFFSSVTGGKDNSATGNQAFVGGGQGNTASGEYATVAGGSDNIAAGNFSFAGGAGARANHQGTFVWSSDGNTTFSSAAIGEFAARANGGFRLICGPNTIAMLNNTVTVGNGDFRVLNGGGSFTGGVNASSFNQTSDRNAKQNFTAVSGREVLEKVISLPIQTWAFKQEESVRHIGPMAQDFRAAFGFGQDEKHIATVDADGVALAAIQGLNEVVKEKDAEIAALKQRLEKLERVVSGLVQKGGN